MRLSVDLLQSAPQFVNPLRLREIDLRGLGITLLDDGPLLLLGDSFDVLNLSLNPLASLQYFPFHSANSHERPGNALVSGGLLKGTSTAMESPAAMLKARRHAAKGKWFDNISDDEADGEEADAEQDSKDVAHRISGTEVDATSKVVGELSDAAPAHSRNLPPSESSMISSAVLAMATGSSPSTDGDAGTVSVAAVGHKALLPPQVPLMLRLTTLLCQRCRISYVSMATCVRALPNITAFLADHNEFAHPRQLLFLRGWKKLEIISLEHNPVVSTCYSAFKYASEMDGRKDRKTSTVGGDAVEANAMHPRALETDGRDGVGQRASVNCEEGVPGLKAAETGANGSISQGEGADEAALANHFLRIFLVVMCPRLKLINFERVTEKEKLRAKELRKRIMKDAARWELGDGAASFTAATPFAGCGLKDRAAAAVAGEVRTRKRGRHAVKATVSAAPRSDEHQNVDESPVEAGAGVEEQPVEGGTGTMDDAAQRKRQRSDDEGPSAARRREETTCTPAQQSEGDASGRAPGAPPQTAKSDSSLKESSFAAKLAELTERTNAAETEEELLALQMEIDALQEAAAQSFSRK